MKKNVETFEDGMFELLVAYKYDETPEYLEEPGNPGTLVAGTVYTELTSVEIIIKGTGIEILDKLTEKQKIHIIKNLNYE